MEQIHPVGKTKVSFNF